MARYSPTLVGPPIAPEPYVATGRGHANDSAGSRLARLRIVLPQSPPPRRHARIYAGLMALLAVVVLSGLIAGVLVRDGAAAVQFWLPLAGRAQPMDPTPTVTPACLVQAVDPSAAKALTQATLTTGLRNPAAQDFRPVDSVTTFHIGARAYVTFQIATHGAGTATVSFCTPAGRIPGRLDVPAGSNGHYAQFSLPLDATQIGPGVVTLSWDGTVAASLPFSIVV